MTKKSCKCFSIQEKEKFLEKLTIAEKLQEVVRDDKDAKTRSWDHRVSSPKTYLNYPRFPGIYETLSLDTSEVTITSDLEGYIGFLCLLFVSSAYMYAYV